MTGTATHAELEVATRSAAGSTGASATATAIAVDAAHTARSYALAAELTG